MLPAAMFREPVQLGECGSLDPGDERRDDIYFFAFGAGFGSEP
jgi:hypothetical protein